MKEIKNTHEAMKWWNEFTPQKRAEASKIWLTKFPDEGFGEAQIKILYLANKLQKLNVSKIELKDYRN